MANKEFNAKAAKESIIKWIREWMDQNGKGCSVVIGISGGKDSTITATLCVEALGKDRVFGVLMPNGRQKDIGDAISVVKYLGIRSSIVNIKKSYDAVLDTIQTGMIDNPIKISDALKQNLPPRIRMATLYAIAQGLPEGGRVVNTCNLSEDWIGYSTKYGDSAGDFSPLGNYTVTEILQIGNLCNIPKVLVYKAPSDGLCGKTDEDNLGFTYAVLDHYIRTGECEDPSIKELIDRKHRINLHKLELLPKAPNESPIAA